MTKKQRFFFKELLTSSSNTEAARKAGYSSKSARISAHKNITKYDQFYLGLFVQAGIDIHSLAKNLRLGVLSKNEDLRFKYTKLALQMIENFISRQEFRESSEEAFDYSEEAKKRLEKYL